MTGTLGTVTIATTGASKWVAARMVAADEWPSVAAVGPAVIVGRGRIVLNAAE